MKRNKVLIVGGVAGGASAAARLRRLDEAAEIIMFEKGGYISFANCGLPYYIGGEIKDKTSLYLQTPEGFALRFNIDVRVFSEVIEIRRDIKSVVVRDMRSGETYSETYDKLVLSPGAEPVRPPIDGIKNSDKIFTLRNIPDALRIKEYIDSADIHDAVIVGGGYIGVEMAENLCLAGLNVTVVEMQDQVIAPLDFDMAAEVSRYIEENGVKLMLKTSVVSVMEKEGKLNITTDRGLIIADIIILAVGVRPETEIAKKAGLETGINGALVTDEHMCTSDPDIYAAGDAVEIREYVSGRRAVIPLAGPANKQGRTIADNICGIDSRYEGSQASSVLKVFDMTVAATGINEKTAKRLGFDYDKVFTYSPDHATYYPGAANMSVKTIFDKKTGKILGAQIVGFNGSDKRCDIMATAIRFGATASDLAKLDLCYAPPYSSAKDPVNMAGYVIENILFDKVKNFHWHDIEKLVNDKNVILLDTRTKAEYDHGHIEGFINIPLDKLRSELEKLDKNKPVYVTCQIGLRGYIACRILIQNGFDCYNLSGGYRLYKSIFGTLSENKERINRIQVKETDRVFQGKGICADVSLDLCGSVCPEPVIRFNKVFRQAKKGDMIKIFVTDPAFAGDIEKLCLRTGNRLIEKTCKNGIYELYIEKTKKN